MRPLLPLTTDSAPLPAAADRTLLYATGLAGSPTSLVIPSVVHVWLRGMELLRMSKAAKRL
ncbi:hypothetical protein ACFVYV_50955, partial [Streptomyces mirabilis]|uniref:hypothetical protein n=1 Tax=Streptomyces mirabilis TaxID=68239 RepID=UPI0036DA3D91